VLRGIVGVAEIGTSGNAGSVVSAEDAGISDGHDPGEFA
jgi:hypothetical protein